MSKHRKPIPKKAPSATSVSASPAPVYRPPSIVVPAFFKNTLFQSGLIFAFAFLLYANTLSHGFTLDDHITITGNQFTQQGVKGIPGILSNDTFFGYFKERGKETLVSGGRYRPLTLVLFALVHEFFGLNSFAFHLLTVLLFAATCLVLYRTLLLLFRPRFGEDYAVLLAWMAAVLFAAHPIHVEAVANVKGCDEIATLLCGLGALYFTLKAFDSQKLVWTVAAGLAFFLACLSKENAATFVVIIPLALWFFRSAKTAEKETKKSVWKSCLPVWIAFLLFFIIRGTILNWSFGETPTELMNNPFLKVEGNQWMPYAFSEKLATVFYTLLKYVQLLFVPHPLTHDYYPKQIELMTFRNPGALLGLATYGFLAWYALSGIRRRDPMRFGILFYLLAISIVSNIVFPVGTLMGDRFVFMPSLGFCIIVAALLLHFFGKKLPVALGIFGVAVVLFSLKTFTRNFDWKDNETLFFADVKISDKSAKIHNACGGVLLDKAKQEKDTSRKQALLQEAVGYFDKAVKIHPTYKDAYLYRGECYFLLKNYDAALPNFREAVRVAPEDPRMKLVLAEGLREAGKYYGEQKKDLSAAQRYLSGAWQYNTKDPETARLLGIVNGVQGKHPDALMWFSKAVELAPGNARYLFDLGTAYYASGDAAKGAEFHRKAMEINPKIMEEMGGKR